MYSSPTPCLFSKVEAAYLRGHINDSQAAPAPLLPVYELDGAPTAAQVLIMGPDDFIVAMVRYASSDSEPGNGDCLGQEELGAGWGREWPQGSPGPNLHPQLPEPALWQWPHHSLRDPPQQPDVRLLLAQQDC